MKVVVQRVKSAKVTVGGEIVGEIGKGLLTLVGIEESDASEQLNWMAKKISELRIFPDENGKMNLSLMDVGGAHLCVSQFTLLGDVRKGRRPAFVRAGDPREAERLFLEFVQISKDLRIPTESGRFGKDMDVELVNDGPVTFVIETPSS